MKSLRSDNGAEYVSNEFKNFYAIEFIHRVIIETHNPQQNGLVKRKKKSILGDARAMLHDQGPLLHLWAEA